MKNDEKFNFKYFFQQYKESNEFITKNLERDINRRNVDRNRKNLINAYLNVKKI